MPRVRWPPGSSSVATTGRILAAMADRVTRQTVDLSGYPDLVVIYLGMKVRTPRGLARLIRTGRQIAASVAAEPAGLLLHESLFFSPLHAGMRQYWRDFAALEGWTRTLPHQDWWREFLCSSGGTGFWHELYCMRGGIEGVYDDMPRLLGLAKFAPTEPALGRMFGARGRLDRGGTAPTPVVPEHDLQ
jgi:hypothetical protein